MPTGLGFTDKLQPLYVCRQGEQARVGLRVQVEHGNSIGICHGGVLLSLADIAAAAAVNAARGIVAGAPTVNLSLDFIAAAKVGEWIESESQNVSLKRRFGFGSGVIRGPRGLVARYNATFYFPDHQGLVTDDATGITVMGALDQSLD